MDKPKSNMKALMVIIISALVILACNQEREPIELNELTPAFASFLKVRTDTARSLVSFDLVRLVPIEWDSVLILRPYVDIDNIKHVQLDNAETVRKTFRYNLYQDQHQYLVFISKNVATSFSKVRLSTIDFTTLMSKAPLISRKEASRLYVRSDNSTNTVVFK